MSELFKCLDAINLKNKNYKYTKKDCSGYMLLMWFSHNRSCMPFVEEINKYLFDISDEMVYSYLYRVIPKGKKYLKWDKGTKDKKLLKREEKVIKELTDIYGISDDEALMLFKLYIK